MRRPNYYRQMTSSEEQYAWGVFQGTLPPANQIGIGDGWGLGDRPWTDKAWNPAPGTPGIPTGWKPQANMPFMAYAVNLGDMAKMDLTSTQVYPGFGRVCDTFIHELTHVWQYYHGDWVKLSSVKAQAWEVITEITAPIELTPKGLKVGKAFDAYGYRPLDHSKSWDDYNSEQQAHIVEDWNWKRDVNSELYPFIAGVIRRQGAKRGRSASLDELCLQL